MYIMYNIYAYNLCIIYYFALFCLFKKYCGNYSENYDTDVSFQILHGCYQHIFYTSTGVNLLSEVLVLLFRSNVVGKLLKSQPMKWKQTQNFKFILICWSRKAEELIPNEIQISFDLVNPSVSIDKTVALLRF